MDTICGANCAACHFRSDCRGCGETCGKPFGGTCVAAAYIRVGGRDAYAAFKNNLLAEVNRLLETAGIPSAEALFELPGSFVNLEYSLPNGQKVTFLDDTRVYLGCQIEFADRGVCYGVVADTDFILICSYSVNDSEPDLLFYQKR